MGGEPEGIQVIIIRKNFGWRAVTKNREEKVRLEKVLQNLSIQSQGTYTEYKWAVSDCVANRG